jgi:hypothetical protein
MSNVSLAELILRFSENPEALTDSELHLIIPALTKIGVRTARGILQERGFARAAKLSEYERVRLVHGHLDEVPIEA